MNDALEMDASLFPGALAPFRNTLFWDHDHSAPTLERPALLDVLARFQRSVDGAWQPACSFWAQLYFNTLLIPATCLLAHDADRTLGVAAIVATVCPVSGTPLRCAMQAADADRRQGEAGSGLAGCLARHVSALVVDLNAVSRLSKGLLRESADRVFDWTLDEIGLADPARATAVKTLLEGCHGPVRQWSRHVSSPARRFCCLRDRLPNIPSCGDTCPRSTTFPRRRHLTQPMTIHNVAELCDGGLPSSKAADS